MAHPARNYAYLESIVHALARWRFRPAVKNGLATISRNIEYTFRMRKDFSPCVYGHGEDTQPDKPLRLYR